MGDVSVTVNVNVNQWNNLVDEGYNELVLIVGDRIYTARNVMELVAQCTAITTRMVNVTNTDRKNILILIVTRFYEQEYSTGKISDTDYSLAKDAIEGLNTSVDVLFDFRKGRYDNSEAAAAVASGCCMLFMWFLSSRKPRVVYETANEKKMRREYIREQRSMPRLNKK